MYTLSITALFQNFCFWGVVSFFPLYLTGERHYSEADATEAYGVFLGIATALPLLGGYASSYLKRYSISILVASLCMVLGCILLSLNIESLLPFSLAFVALGYGLFWPPVLALQGRLYDCRESLRDGGFSIFYAVSSGGILLTQTVNSLVLQAYGWAPLYLTLAVAGLLGIASFILSYRHYRSVDSAKAQPHIQLCQASLYAAYYHGQKAHNFHLNLGRIYNHFLDGMQSDGIIGFFLCQELCPSTSSWLRGSAHCLSVIFCVNGRHNGTRYGNLLAFSKPNRHPT